MRRVLSALLTSGLLLTTLPQISLAQGLPGFTLFGGPRRENQLGFRLDSGEANRWDRYRLRIPADKVELAIAQFTISYPDYYRGSFDTENVQVRLGRGRRAQVVPIDQVIWDQENHQIEIYPVEPIPAGSQVELVFSNVKNPTFGGMYYFNCRILTPGDVPLLRYLGTWILSIT